jgi:hypothetical protein
MMQIEERITRTTRQILHSISKASCPISAVGTYFSTNANMPCRMGTKLNTRPPLRITLQLSTRIHILPSCKLRPIHTDTIPQIPVDTMIAYSFSGSNRIHIPLERAIVYTLSLSFPIASKPRLRIQQWGGSKVPCVKRLIPVRLCAGVTTHCLQKLLMRVYKKAVIREESADMVNSVSAHGVGLLELVEAGARGVCGE